MILGVVCVLLFWCCLFGFNVPIRAVMERVLVSRREVVARFDLRGTPQPALTRRFKRFFLAFSVVLLMILLVTNFSWQDLGPEIGIVVGSWLVLLVLWSLYQRSRTYRTETVVFDRDGMTIFPPRMSRVGDGTFHTRIDWQDCFGYSVLRGHLLLALRPFGHVEQSYGPYREEMTAVLDLLGVRKLTLFDLLNPEDADAERLLEAEQHVQQMVDDLLLGLQYELRQYGLRMDAEQMYSDPNPEQPTDRFAFLKLRLWEDGVEECVQQADWLIWARYEDVLELLTLPDVRLYEMLDDKVQSMIEARLKERGITPAPVLLQ